MDEQLLLDYKIATGWGTNIILAEVEKLNCNYRIALQFYLSEARMPNPVEQKLLNAFEFDAVRNFLHIQKSLKLNNF